MACNDNSQEGEFKQERGGGKITTKRNAQEAPKPYDRPISAFGRIFAAVKDILKPAIVTEAMSRVYDAQKEEERAGGVHKFACDTGYETVCNSSGAEEVTVEVDGYQAVFQSRVLHDEMALLKSKINDAVSSSEQACERQLSFRRNALEPSSRSFDSPTLTTPAVFPNKTSLPSSHVGHPASLASRCNNIPKSSNDVSRSLGYHAISATKSNVAPRETTESSAMNGASIATPSKFESIIGTPSLSSRRCGAETSATKPGFKMSRFCESVEKIRAGTSLLNRSRAELAALSESCGADSSFYVGRTSFGGAASTYKMNAKASAILTSPYETRPTVRKCVQVSPGGRGETKVMSVTAQRILETMEKSEESSMYLNRSRDASICNSPLSFTPSYRRNSSQFSTIARNDVLTRQSGGPPVKQLITPSVSVLKPMKATIVESRDTYQSLRPTLSDERMETQALWETGYSLPFGNKQLTGLENVDSIAAVGGKFKKPPKHYLSRLSDVEEASSNSALKSIQPFPSFPVDFSFSMPKESVIACALADAKETAFRAKGSEISLEAFVFSPPKIVQEMPENDTSRSTTSGVKATSEKANIGGTPTAVPLSLFFKKSSNVWTCSECLVDNKCTDTVCVACMASRPGIVSGDLDKSKLPISQTSAGAAPGFTLNTNGGGFKFGSGLISNTGFGDKVDSTAQNGASNFSSNNSGSSTSFGGFRFSESLVGGSRIVSEKEDFDSLDDLTRPPLRSDVGKSPVRKALTNTEESSKDKPLSELFKKPTNVWTCGECYISNKNELDRCVSCEASKPGTSSQLFTQFGCNSVSMVPETVTKPANNSMSFGAKPLSELFKKPVDSWTCTECFVLNKATRNTCLSCETARSINATPTTSQPTINHDSTKPLNELFKKPVDIWICNECYVSNKNDRKTCQSCETAKPHATQPPVLSAAGQFVVFSDAKPLSELFKKPVDVWTCNECYISNKNDRTTCQSCETVKPRATQLPVLSSARQFVVSSDAKPLSELFKKPADVWTCKECFVANKNDLTRCQSCETAKPSTQLPNSSSSVPSPVVSASNAKPLSELFKKAVDTWTCGECYVTNKSDQTSCASCETVRPGASVPVQVKTSTASMFTFGAQNPVAFGSSKGHVASAFNASSTFASSSTGPFQFGQQPTEAKANTKNTSMRSFVFGQPLPVSNDDVAEKSHSFIAETNIQTFGFSQPNLDVSTSVSAKSVSSSNASGFGVSFKTNVTVSSFANSSSSASLAGASLGSTSATTMCSSFVFGAPVSIAMTSSAAPVDQKPIQTGFGASDPKIPAFGASIGSNAAVKPQFGVFGASTESNAKVTPQFGMFGASTVSNTAVVPHFFVPPAGGESIFGSTSSSSIPQSSFVAPSLRNSQSSSASINVAETTSTVPSSFMFGAGDSQSTSTLFTFGNHNTSSSAGSGASLASTAGKRSRDEGDANSTKRATGNFTFGAPSVSQSSASFTFGQFQGTGAPVAAAPFAAAPGLSQGFDFGSSAPMFNIPSSVGGAPSSSVFQFGRSDAMPPSFQNPFDVGASSSASSISNRVIKKAERRLGKNRR